MKTKSEDCCLDFYLCEVCGNLIIKLNDSGLTPQCCGRDMVKLTPNLDDTASIEKHVPDWIMDGCKLIVKVGSEEHPMTHDHYIQWIVVKTNLGIHAKSLKPEGVPSATFKLCKCEKIEAIYEYCNIHGLWKTSKEGPEYECPLYGI